MRKVTEEDIKEWKKIFNEYKLILKPNRQSIKQVIDYLQQRYTLKDVTSAEFSKAVMDTITMNKPFAEKIPNGSKLEPIVFEIFRDENAKDLYEYQDNIYNGCPIRVGMEKVTGCVFVEGSDELADEITVFQGLDEMDLKNYYLVANYVRCLKKFHVM